MRGDLEKYLLNEKENLNITSFNDLFSNTYYVLQIGMLHRVLFCFSLNLKGKPNLKFKRNIILLKIFALCENDVKCTHLT